MDLENLEGVLVILAIIAIILGIIFARRYRKSRKFFTDEDLDDEQKEAVQYTYDKPMLVSAGPGSGKTRVVVERVKDLILEQDIPPERILCMTFSKAGEGTMYNRLKNDEQLRKGLAKKKTNPKTNRLEDKQPTTENGEKEFPEDRVRTFHSLCQEMLNRPRVFNVKKDNINENEIFKWSEDGEVWRDKFKERFENEKLGFKILKPAGKKIEETIIQLNEGVSGWKKEDKGIKDLKKYLDDNEKNIENDDYLKKLHDLQIYFKEYSEHLTSNDQIDYDDQLQKALNDKLVDKSEFLESQVNKYDHIIIDEFQDNNYLQFEVLKKLTPNGHVTVVGDKNQSIYSFQGANFEIFREFKKHYKNIKKVHLKFNYRSTPQIMSLANRLLKKDDKSYEGVKTKNADGKAIQIHQFCNTRDEYDFFVKEITVMINQKFKKHNGKMFEAKLSNFVILVRTNKIRIEIHRHLVGKGIPTRMKGFTAFKYGENKVSRFLDSFLKNNGLSKELKLEYLVEKLGSSVREELWENNESEVVYRVLLNVSSDFLKKLPSAKIENFVEYVRVEGKPRIGKFPKITNAVNIKTSHLVKGEQYPFVFISTSHQNHFPLDYKEREMKVPPKYLQYKLEKCPSCQEPVKYGSSKIHCSGTAKHDIEEVLHDKEERRLYYVPLTRTMYELFITYSKESMDEKEQKRSDFLDDLECFTDKKNISYQNECEDEENSVNQDG